MTGRLTEACYASVKEEYESDQQLLTAYSTEEDTTIAIVRKPGNSSIVTYCDEHMPELGMPRKPLQLFHELRAGYQTNSAVSDPHNKAFADAKLEKEYHEYIRTSGQAQKAIDEIAQRVRFGENIRLVCYEEDGERCHRHLLLNIIEERISSSESKFVFVRDKRKAGQ